MCTRCAVLRRVGQIVCGRRARRPSVVYCSLRDCIYRSPRRGSFLSTHPSVDRLYPRVRVPRSAYSAQCRRGATRGGAVRPAPRWHPKSRPLRARRPNLRLWTANCSSTTRPCLRNVRSHTPSRSHRTGADRARRVRCDSVGDKNTVRKICDSFLKRSADTKERLIKAMEEKAMQDLRRHAHSLKGACGYICSEQLRGSALKLQLACDEINEGRSTDMANVEEGSRRVHDELDQVIAAINQYLEAGDAK